MTPNAIPVAAFRASAIGADNVGTETAERVIPLTIFAAGKQRFEFVVRGFAGNREAKILAFRHLPLEENGWQREMTSCRHLRNEPRGCVFLIERL